jgi:glutaredoxin
LPSGNTIKIQGYEHYALDELCKKENSNENDIITGSKNVPTIWYNDNDNKKHRHFVDIFIPSINKCIEVKSTWTFKKQKEIVFLKQTAAKELGFLYEIWVYDNKGNKVEFYN